MAESAPPTAEEATEVESLLRFKETLNFSKLVQSYLVPSEHSEAADTVLPSVKLIGQERDGAILFAWDAQSDNGEIVTQVGIYPPVRPTFQGAYHPLYKHEYCVDICAASVNFEKTLLAFTVKEVFENAVTYSTFVAEIQPQGRSFNLNLGGPLFRKLQFLQPQISTPRTRIGRHHYVSRLLVVIPDDCVCLYQFRMQEVRLGSVLTQQPEQEVIAENFSWYQWDPQPQWLYYARFESTMSPIQASVSGRNSLVLHCISFPSSSPSFQLLLTVSLPLPYNQQLYSHSATYYSSPFAFTPPVRETNLQILHRRDGIWCVCLQHCTGTLLPSDSNSDCENLDTPQGSKIDYSIYILHNGYVMYSQVPLAAPAKESLYIHFMLMLGCFVVAYVPGFMLHILNLGPNTDPCHHLAFGPELSPQFPTPSVVKGANFFASDSPILATTAICPSHDAALLECNSGVIFECGLHFAGFFQLFMSCDNPKMMEDLLHLMVVGFRQHGLALSMIEHICQTPMQLVDHRLFAEFIVASAFANVHLDCKRYIVKQLPLTISSTFRGAVFKNEDGSKLAMCKLTPMPSFIKQLLVQSDQKLVSASPEELINHKPPSDQPFEMLCFIAVTSQPMIARLDLRELTANTEDNSNGASGSLALNQKSKKRSRGKKGTVSPELSPPSRTARLKNTVTTLTRLSRGSKSPVSRSVPDPQEMLNFLDCDEDEVDQLASMSQTFREKLIKAISKGLSLRSKSTGVYSAVTNYCQELEKHSCKLLLVIWQSLGFSMDNHPLHSPINRKPTTKEQILYELLEGYHLAHMELGFPVPLGFHTLLICMGYLCLDSTLFLQYLRNGAFTPTRKFVELLLADCGRQDEQQIFHIICNLEYSLSQYALQHWHNPTIEQLEASSQSVN